MKKIFCLLMATLAVIIVCSSCSKDDEKPTIKNPLAGTLWEEDDDHPMRIEFINDTQVRVWGALATEDTGTYTISNNGNTVTFSSLITTIGINTREYKYGTFTSNTLTVHFTLAGQGVKAPTNVTCYLYKR